jgi:hypothetical protein
MSKAKDYSKAQTWRLLTTLLRAWGVGFLLAVRGTIWLIRKSVGLAPFGRPRRPDEGLVD